MKVQTLTVLTAIAFLLGSAGANANNSVQVGSPGLDNQPSTPASCPTGCRLEVVHDGSGNTAYVHDDSPNAEGVYRARFTVDVGSLDIPVTGTWIYLFTARSQEPNNLVRVMLRKRSSTDYHIRAIVRRDSGSNDNRWWFFPTSTDTAAYGGFGATPGSPLTIELEWTMASSPGADDGTFRMWKNGNLKVDSSGSGIGIDNDERPLDNIRLGNTNNVGAVSTTGTLLFDDFQSFRSTAP